jgi:DNA-binding MarR family transcriptional regulator
MQALSAKVVSVKAGSATAVGVKAIGVKAISAKSIKNNGRRPARAATMAAVDDRLALRVWLRLLACSTQLQAEVGGRMRAEYGNTLARFDLLAQLARFPEGLRMVELSRRLLMTGANVTVLTDQLEGERLVRRTPDPDDGRAYRVRLTPKGRRQFERMAGAHQQWIRAHFAVLNADEQAALLALLTRLKDSLGLPASHAD